MLLAPWGHEIDNVTILTINLIENGTWIWPPSVIYLVLLPLISYLGIVGNKINPFAPKIIVNILYIY